MEILLVMALIGGIAMWFILREKPVKENMPVAPYKLEPITETVVETTTIPQEIAEAPVIKKVRKPRTPKVEKEIEKPIPKKVAVKKATPPTKAVAMKAPKPKKI
jgi:hypothetical protein